MVRYKLDDFHNNTEKQHQMIKQVKFIPTLHYKHLRCGVTIQCSDSKINAYLNSIQNY